MDAEKRKTMEKPGSVAPMAQSPAQEREPDPSVDPEAAEFEWTPELEAMAETCTEDETIFETWVQRVVKQLWFPPDRRKVRQELTEHFADRQSELIDRGMSWRDASARAVEMMGEPESLGRLFRQVHHPILGWALRLTRIMLAVVIIAVLVPLLYGRYSIDVFRAEDTAALLDGYSSRTVGDQTNTVLARRRASCTDRITLGPFDVRVEGVSYKLEQVEHLLPDGDSYINEIEECDIVLRYTAAPWHHMRQDVVNRYLRIVDDKGNEYYNRDYQQANSQKSYYQYTWRSGFNSFVSAIHFDKMPHEAEYVDLIFIQGETEKRLRVRFTGWSLEPASTPEPLADAAAAAAALAEKTAVVPGISKPELVWSRSFRQAEPSDPEDSFSVLWAQQACYREALVPSVGRLQMDCVLLFPGDPSDYPIDTYELRRRLEITDPTAEAAKVSFDLYSLPLRYADAILWRVQWTCETETERVILTDADGSQGRPCALTLVWEEEKGP